MEVHLRVVKGPTRVKTIRMRTADCLIGRAKGSKIRIPSGLVSRRHCLLFFDQGGLFVKDLQSSNGTYINGLRISGKRLVRPGDWLRVGPITFMAE